MQTIGHFSIEFIVGTEKMKAKKKKEKKDDKQTNSVSSFLVEVLQVRTAPYTWQSQSSLVRFSGARCWCNADS